MSRMIDADVLKAAFETDGYLSPYMQRMIDACPTVGEWISAKDRLPDFDGAVLACTRYGEIRVFLSDEDGDWFDERGSFYSRNTSGEVTHWMPLPKPPKEDAE